MASNFLQLVGKRIRILRKGKGYTQEHLAEKAGIHYTYISDIERAERNISLETLEKIIIALEVPPIEVFRFDESEALQDKQEITELINLLSNLLIDRNLEEVRLLVKIAKEIASTYDALREEK